MIVNLIVCLIFGLVKDVVNVVVVENNYALFSILCKLLVIGLQSSYANKSKLIPKTSTHPILVIHRLSKKNSQSNWKSKKGKRLVPVCHRQRQLCLNTVRPYTPPEPA